MLFPRLLKRFGHHLRPVGHLFGGATFAALLPLITAPINSRIYDPDAFGLFALVLAISSILSIPYVAGFSRVQMLSESEADADQQFRTLASALTLPAIIMGMGSILTVPFGWKTFQVAALSSIIAVLGSFSSLCTSWLIVSSQFKPLAVNRVLQMIVTAIVSIGVGLAGFKMWGIVLGHLAGCAISAGIMSRYVPEFRPNIRSAAVDLKKTIVAHHKLFSTALPAEALNTITHTIPTMLFSAYAGPTFLGLFNMANRLLEMPASLVSSVTSQYFQGLAVKRNMGGQSLLPLVLGYSITLFVLCSPFFIVGLIYAPDLAGWALGEKWRGAGELSRYLSVYILFRIVVSPVTFVVFLRKAFMASLVMDIGLVALIGGGLFVCLYVYKNSELAVIWFGAVYSVSYLISFWLSCFYARNKAAGLIREPA